MRAHSKHYYCTVVCVVTYIPLFSMCICVDMSFYYCEDNNMYSLVYLLAILITCSCSRVEAVASVWCSDNDLVIEILTMLQ